MDNKENKYDIKTLVKKWMQGSLSAEEEAYFETWYTSFNDEEVHVKESVYRDAPDLKETMYARLMKRIEEDTVQPKRIVRSFPVRRLLRISAVAASLLAIVTFGLLVFNNQQTENKDEMAVIINDDVSPGSNKAVLVLPNGQKIDLSNDYEGIVVGEEGVAYEDGTSIFSETGAADTENWYSIAVPYGGQYRVVLPDGSKVWLNSGGMLKYPSRFSSGGRQVHLQGEAYFEVAHHTVADNRGKSVRVPFFVHTSSHQVEVLGTEFNINAYENESLNRITLVNGSVKVYLLDNSNISRILKPSQQALISGQSITVKNVDVEQEVAWRMGIFNFDDLQLSNIMRQLERWYDIDVDYASLPDIHFTGSIGKHVNLSEVLSMLELTSNIKFEVKNKSVGVTKRK